MENITRIRRFVELLVAIFPIIWIRDFRFFFLNETYQAFLLFPVRRKKNKTVIEKILLKRDYRRLEYIQMVLLLQQLTRFRLIDFDSSVGRNVSGE